MKKLLVLSAFATLCAGLFAAPVMKITLKSGSISDFNMEQLSKIEFNETSIIAGQSFLIESIRKIEFYEGTSIVDPQGSKKTVANAILFTQSGPNLTMNTPMNTDLSVSLFGMNGRKIKELFRGSVTEPSLTVTTSGIAAGVYTVVVNSGNELFVQKLMIQ